MLIDEFLPQYDVVERHQIEVYAPAQPVYAAVRSLDLNGSEVVRWLFLLRSLPGLLGSCRIKNRGLGLTLDELLHNGFILLSEKPPQEIVLGVVGRFWTIAGELQHLKATEFLSFNKSGYAKAAWNFSLTEQGNKTLLATETRVYCLDEASRQRFRMYWLLIRPFSGLIRREALRVTKQRVEKSMASST